MLLAVDVGNTNTKFALVDGGAIVHRWRLSTDAARTADEYAVWLNQLMILEGIDRSAISAAIISTVVPPTLFDLTRLCIKYFGVEPMVVGAPGIDPGIGLAVDNPQDVGADRVVTASAAHHSVTNLSAHKKCVSCKLKLLSGDARFIACPLVAGQ